MNDEQPAWMKEHDASDTKRFNELDAKIAGLATKDDLKGLATEASVRDVVHLQRNFVHAAKLMEGGGKWSFRFIIALATLIGALSVILGGWKAAFAWLLSRI